MKVDYNMPANYYNVMGVSPTATTRELRSKYRALSLQYHPDKVDSVSPEDEALYLRIQKANEILKDEVARQAYDKLGDEIHDCTRCTTERDYLMSSLTHFITFYASTAVVLIIMGILGKGDFARYWRFVGLLAMSALEGTILFTSRDPLPYFFPWRTPSEKITLLHQLFIVTFIALSQVGPIWFPADPKGNLKQVVQDLDTVYKLLYRESAASFRTAFEPYKDDPKAAGLLQRRMEKLTVDQKLLEVDREYGAVYQTAQSRIIAAPRK
ncbi:hypothetical protein HK102_007109 [Quaeritorhiza haematococci]|nr:hypothetical protein HK102_007109 [Quaeritorhiza haematococci]